ncbi:MAG: hypothetical protein ACHP7N_08595 [Caulobacterales bacterium]
MATEESLARVLNLTMVSLLAILVFPFTVWVAATEFISVRNIYLSLTPQEQGHLSRFAQSILMLAFGCILTVRFAGWWVGGWKRLAASHGRS